MKLTPVFGITTPIMKYIEKEARICCFDGPAIVE
jgi:hypothetical protein